MLALDLILSFLLVSTLLSLSPGPDNIFVLLQSAYYGAKAGIVITLGLCSGLVVHTAVVALGLATLFQSSDLVFTIVKTVGAVYLLYLAWQTFRAPVNTIDVDDAATDNPISLRQYYLRGLIMNVSNPKVSIFFLAFLPQFVEPEQGAVLPQIFTLGALFMLSAFVVFTSVAIFAGQIGHFLKRSKKVQLWLNRVVVVVFSGLAIRLLMLENT